MKLCLDGTDIRWILLADKIVSSNPGVKSMFGIYQIGFGQILTCELELSLFSFAVGI